MWAPVSNDATGDGEATDAASRVAGMNFGDVESELDQRHRNSNNI
jgi:hypothetical protein